MGCAILHDLNRGFCMHVVSLVENFLDSFIGFVIGYINSLALSSSNGRVIRKMLIISRSGYSSNQMSALQLSLQVSNLSKLANAQSLYPSWQTSWGNLHSLHEFVFLYNSNTLRSYTGHGHPKPCIVQTLRNYYVPIGDSVCD